MFEQKINLSFFKKIDSVLILSQSKAIFVLITQLEFHSFFFWKMEIKISSFKRKKKKKKKEKRRKNRKKHYFERKKQFELNVLLDFFFGTYIFIYICNGIDYFNYFNSWFVEKVSCVEVCSCLHTLYYYFF